MRVLHVTDYYVPRLGGIELHVRDLADHQRAAGHGAEVATVMAGEPDACWVHRLGASGERNATTPAAAVRRLEQLVEERAVEVVHAHISAYSPFATLAARRLSLLGVPVVVTVHSMWRGYGPVPALATRVLSARAWPVVWSAVSEGAAGEVRRALGPSRPVRVLPNAVDVARWRPAGAELDQAVESALRPADPGRVRTIASVMRLTRTKRAVPLAGLLARVRAAVPAGIPLRAVVIGDGHQRRALERELSRRGLESWVVLTGRLTRPAIRRHLLAADVFLAPADRESFGIAALEARSLGLAVVASRDSGVAEFVRHGWEGVLATSDRGLAEAVARLVTDEELARRIRLNNLLVPPRHDWTAAVAGADALYRLAERETRGTRVPT
jgi:glycosyltransferase involved in cell wall biosynthesis